MALARAARARLLAAALAAAAGLGLPAGTATASPASGGAGESGKAGKPGTARKASTVIADVRGLRSDRGKALVALFRSSKGFPDEARKAWRRAEVPIRKGAARAVFKNVPPGRYALAVLHDEDGDREMKTGLFGRPKEGYGVSRNPPARMGPPRYEDAVLPIRPSRRITVHIDMKY